MKFNLATVDPRTHETDCIVIGVYDQSEMTPTAKKVNHLSDGHIQTIINYGEFQGKVGQTFLLYQVPNLASARVLLVGCGKKEPVAIRDYRKIIYNSVKALNNAKIKRITSFLTEVDVLGLSFPWKIKHAVEVTFDAIYRFDQFKTTKEHTSLEEITLDLPKSSYRKTATEALKQAIGISGGVAYTKNLANLPSNRCTPTYLANEAKKLSKSYSSINVKVMDESEIKKLGMNAFLAVAKGSKEPPKLVCIEYKGKKKKEAPVALIGKGVTFDTGGISLKPAESMVGMKYDMCGAATVLGTIKAAADLSLPISIVGIIPMTENMPGGGATKPEDIVTTLSGQTVEILNTDAEGRLILADALTYCERYKPDVIIDIATLTGAVVIALGYHASGLLSNYEPLAKDLLQAGIESFDRAWQMPLWEEYQDQLKSPFADMSNVGGRPAGTITASCFLSRFTKGQHWAHLDVAGTAAMMSGVDRYATGRPVPLLVQYLINRCRKGI